MPGEEAAGLVALPGEGGAEEGEGLACAGRGLEEGVAVALAAGAVEGVDDAAHEGELGPVGFVRELDWDASDLVGTGAGLAGVRVLEGRRRGGHGPIPFEAGSDFSEVRRSGREIDGERLAGPNGREERRAWRRRKSRKRRSEDEGLAREFALLLFEFAAFLLTLILLIKKRGKSLYSNPLL